MANKKNKRQVKKKAAKRAPKSKKASPKTRSPIDRVIEQAKEPLSLIETLKEEGMARAGYLLGMAAEVAGTMTKQNLGAQIAEFGGAVGIVTKADLARIEKKLQDLSDRLDSLESGDPSLGDAQDDVEEGNEVMSRDKDEPYEEESYRVKSDYAATRTAEEE